MADAGSSSTSSTCHCETVCYCGLRERRGVYGEGVGEGESFRSSTIISWQHFPRSTSSRSRCDGSSMGSPQVPSLTEASCKPETAREKTWSSKSSPTDEYPITKSVSQLNAEHYLQIRHVHEFFNFLIGHLICAEPDDPIQYLSEILDRCVHFRDCYGEEPLLVSRYHIKSLYDTFDPYGKGYITVDQYEVAMDNIGITKGITPNNPKPPLNSFGMVDEKYFLAEAHRCLRENLMKMVRVPNAWEENRLVWKRRMLQKYGTEPKEEFRTDAEDEEVEEPGEEWAYSCGCGIVKPVVCPGTCPCPPKMRHEPEQLFLTS